MTFAIDLGTPRHGWIEVRITIDVERFAFNASHVLNDPIRELAELARFTASGERGHVRAHFWLEPQGYELAVTRNDELCVSLRRSEDAFPSLDNPVLVIERPLDAVSFVREIVRCLRAAQPSFPPVAGAHWSEPFPTKLLDELVAKHL